MCIFHFVTIWWHWVTYGYFTTLIQFDKTTQVKTTLRLEHPRAWLSQACLPASLRLLTVCAQIDRFLFSFPSAPVLSFYLTLLSRVTLAKTKTLPSTVAFTTCRTLKHHVQIAIRVQLNVEENKTCRQSNTTCPLQRGNTVWTQAEKVGFFPQSSLGGLLAPPTPYKFMHVYERMLYLSFHLHPLHLGQSRKSCRLRHLEGKTKIRLN